MRSGLTRREEEPVYWGTVNMDRPHPEGIRGIDRYLLAVILLYVVANVAVLYYFPDAAFEALQFFSFVAPPLGLAALCAWQMILSAVFPAIRFHWGVWLASVLVLLAGGCINFFLYFAASSSV